MSDQVESTPTSRYQAVKLAHNLNTGRLRELETKGTSYVLTETELDEVVRLERQVANQAQVLERLEHEMAHAQQVVDVEGVVSRWGDLATAKRDCYTRLVYAMAEVEEAMSHLMAVHAAQEREVAQLPRAITSRWVFPDGATMHRRIAGRMPGGMDGVVSLRALTKGELDQILDVDPGVVHIPVRVLAGYVEGKR